MTDFFDETAGAPEAPAAATTQAAAAPPAHDLFAPQTPATPAVPARDPLPHYGKGRLVREKTADGSKGRIGLVIASGELAPDEQGERPAVVVGWFESVSHPIVTDGVEPIDS